MKVELLRRYRGAFAAISAVLDCESVSVLSILCRIQILRKGERVGGQQISKVVRSGQARYGQGWMGQGQGLNRRSEWASKRKSFEELSRW